MTSEAETQPVKMNSDAHEDCAPADTRSTWRLLNQLSHARLANNRDPSELSAQCSEYFKYLHVS